MDQKDTSSPRRSVVLAGILLILLGAVILLTPGMPRAHNPFYNLLLNALPVWCEYIMGVGVVIFSVACISAKREEQGVPEEDGNIQEK